MVLIASQGVLSSHSGTGWSVLFYKAKLLKRSHPAHVLNPKRSFGVKIGCIVCWSLCFLDAIWEQRQLLLAWQGGFWGWVFFWEVLTFVSFPLCRLNNKPKPSQGQPRQRLKRRTQAKRSNETSWEARPPETRWKTRPARQTPHSRQAGHTKKAFRSPKLLRRNSWASCAPMLSP